jgi:hypothetical protein
VDGRSRIKRWVTPTGVASVLLLTGCAAGGSSAQSGAEKSAVASGASRLVQGRYVSEFPGEDGADPVRFESEFVSDGNRRLRLQTTQYQGQEQGERYLWIWDGKSLLVVSKWNQSEYTLYEAPEEHPDEFGLVRDFQRGFRLDPAGKEFAEHCPQARQVETEPLLGRTAVHYACTPAPQPEGAPPGTSNLWLDEATKWLLKDDTTRAELLDFDPKVDDSTFSTLIDLQSLTSNGINPAVLGVLAGGPGKPGLPLVPAGVTLPVAYEEGSTVQQRYGVFAQVGFAFVTSDGTLAATYDRALTRGELEKALASLR